MSTQPRLPRHRITRETSVGTVVDVQYTVVSADLARIVSYRRRKPGRDTFRRVPEMEGRTCSLAQLGVAPPAETPIPLFAPAAGRPRARRRRRA